ncbi:MAG TPA: metal ABC transporter permease [Anaerolineaceae bacterium]|nr:metal ABC transporter permease [Anaerolineaceae bacterium]HQC64030.1 metal ABC transporter permease [Anaerolineaceae bacterium]
MFNTLAEIFSYEFMQNALLAGVLVSLVSGIIGTLVVLNRMVGISGGIAHAAYGGVGIASYFGFDPVLGAVLFSLLSSVTMGVAHRKLRERSDTMIGVMWAVGMATGIIFVSLTPGYRANLMSYLFGSILAVSKQDIWWMAGVALATVLFVALFYRQLLAISFDEEFATVRNLPVTALSVLLLIMTGLAVVVAMRVVGLIMVIALLTIPSAIASMFFKNMRVIMLVAVGLGIVFISAGLVISFLSNLPAAAVIILLAGLVYFLAFVIKRILLKTKT